jgi:DnaD/phage-associated family protein
MLPTSGTKEKLSYLILSHLTSFYNKEVNKMAKFRQVHVEFWQDGFVLDLTPEEKYFYIYLMTNSKTSQCGIYELPKRIIETETGYNRETVDKLLQRFIDYGKVLYDESTKEIMLINWVKYNAIKSTTVISCIKKELESIKNKSFIKAFYTLCIRYGYPIGTVCIDQGEEQEEEREQEEEKEQQQERQNVVADDFYQQNFGPLNSFIGQQIASWVNDLSEEIVIEAMKRALAQQKKWSYAEGILRNWANQNVRTLTDVQDLDKEFENRGLRQGRVDSGKIAAAEQFARENGIPF